MAFRSSGVYVALATCLRAKKGLFGEWSEEGDKLTCHRSGISIITKTVIPEQFLNCPSATPKIPTAERLILDKYNDKSLIGQDIILGGGVK